MESSIFRLAETWEDENKHVAILFKDDWICGHGHSWDANLQCKLDLDFMEEEEYQNDFDNLFNAFALNNDKDDSLALLLYITALESLITEGQQVKRIRLVVIVPKLVSIDGITSFELATVIDELYKERNNFVHAG